MRKLACTVALLIGCGGRQDTGGMSERIRQLETEVATLKAAPPAPAPVPPPRDRLDDGASADRPSASKKRMPPHASLPPDVAELQAKVTQLEGSHNEMWNEVERLLFGDVIASDAAVKRGQPRPEPRGDVAYSVPIAGNPTDQPGDDTAKVTWVVGIELSEPFTRRLLETAKTLRTSYGKDLRMVFKPMVVHEWGIASAMLLCAADRQGKFEQGIAALLAIDLKGVRTDFRIGPLRQRFHFLDKVQAEADLTGSCKKQMRDEQTWAKSKFGMVGTPYSFINGRYVAGAQGEEQFRKLIDEELARANQELGNASSKGYYDRLVKRGTKAP
ncbi:MAG: thioredoxin domain-containing protein [Deltaproteobacteria bacterium]|nr:thioredoxin domain-containing protein [Deltaproteobacteria bacterium]MCW5804537.1 thioredoxin domain-containing protein [Deltaproteobacteria bacterium]